MPPTSSLALAGEQGIESLVDIERRLRAARRAA
jgi:hypothetical protein